MTYNEIEETAYWHICKALDVLEEYYKDESGLDDYIIQRKIQEDMERIIEECIEEMP